MFRETFFLGVLLALSVTDAAVAQQQGQQSPPRQPTGIERRAQSLRADEKVGRSWERGYDQRAMSAMANLPKVRAALAKMWQKFGMTPEDARAVAATFRLNDNDMVRPEALYGKSDDEIAGLLQSAINGKHYQLANMLLIEYQRKRLYKTDERPYHSAH